MNQENDCNSPDSTIGIGCIDDNARSYGGGRDEGVSGAKAWCCSNSGGKEQHAGCTKKMEAKVEIIPLVGVCDKAVCKTFGTLKTKVPDFCKGAKCEPAECCDAAKAKAPRRSSGPGTVLTLIVALFAASATT